MTSGVILLAQAMEYGLNLDHFSSASICLQTGGIHKITQWHQHNHLPSNVPGLNNNPVTCICGHNFLIPVLASQEG